MSVIVRIPSARARSPERGSADQKFNEEGTELTFPLRQSVKWRDGKPFTA
jgi:ABC-type transport system substrate-binding protein